ncbi:MAG TPA: Gfo/Idh/MocA family oxidoreductase [Beutenbergiaceae bacterium]|nr:Gfo/Idh/MocA family oxidoreductase [Beutenbergiaceae bacterium]
MTLSVAVVGVRGYGRQHLETLAELADEGLMKVTAVVDTQPTDGLDYIPASAGRFTSLEEMLHTTVPDVVVLATPIHTHGPLAKQAMRAGSHVLMEKPPTATLAEFESVVSVAEETGKACQVGFQSFGSHALAEIASRVTAGQIGELRSIGGVGTWLRSTDYYSRAAWAGRRRLDDREVVDGVVTNPLAHAVATALRIAGAGRSDHIEEVITDLYHAHDIEADDTSAVRVRTTGGLTLSFGLTLAAPTHHAPRVIVYGTAGEMDFRYTEDILTVRTGEGTEELTFGRTGLLANLREHILHGEPLLADVRDTGAFMRVLEAVRTAPDPTPIDPRYVTWLDDEHGRHPVVDDVESWCEQVAIQGRTFSELGAPWAQPARA